MIYSKILDHMVAFHIVGFNHDVIPFSSEHLFVINNPKTIKEHEDRCIHNSTECIVTKSVIHCWWLFDSVSNLNPL